MNLLPAAQATLLLTSYFGNANNDEMKPLTNSEWGRFALWLKTKETNPADLLTPDAVSLLSGWQDRSVSVERILALLGRGHSLALAVEKWQRAGLWIVTRSDREYPQRLKSRLKNYSPPVLFGCGNKALLSQGGLAVVGSRNAGHQDIAFTQQVGEKAASEGKSVVSGGARGVDETAMLSAMNRGGTVIGVMADSLLRAATSAKWRKGLMDGNVVLISPFYPEAGFNAGNAMGRNKYIYCLADSALVIHSGKKGGTLNGAEENLKKGWVPLWVKPTDDLEAANADLVAKGARWCAAEIQAVDITGLFTPSEGTGEVQKEQPDMFAASPAPLQRTPADSFAYSNPPDKPQSLLLHEDKPAYNFIDFYQIFIQALRHLTDEPVTLEHITKVTSLHKSQVNDWLKRAENEGAVKKLLNPVRYQFMNPD